MEQGLVQKQTHLYDPLIYDQLVLRNNGKKTFFLKKYGVHSFSPHGEKKIKRKETYSSRWFVELSVKHKTIYFLEDNITTFMTVGIGQCSLFL